MPATPRISSNKLEDCVSSYDIVIIGGGLVGASLAVALVPTNKKVLVVESVPHQSHSQPSYDERTVALTHSAKLIFSAMGIWDEILNLGVEPILDIHISNRGHFGQTHLSHKHAGTDALGYVVPTRTIGQVLWDKMSEHENTTVVCPATAEDIEFQDDGTTVTIEQDNTTHSVNAQLVVLADGGRSPLAKHLANQIQDNTDDGSSNHYQSSSYNQSAVLSIVSVDREHNGRAYERFTDEGPLALLPHSKINGQHRYAVVWSTQDKNLESRLGLSDTDFAAALQAAFGHRAGSFSAPSKRMAYPLKRSSLSHPAASRVIVIGNAAHTVHPVAGQGFNLGLRDVAALAELIYCNEDPGSQSMIDQYLGSRKRDTAMVSAFTHGLIEVFTSQSKPISFVRNLGLNTIEHLPIAKRFLLNRTMGLSVGASGRQSRMALGIPLNE